MANYIKTTIEQQLAQRSGQISRSQQEGGTQYIDDLTGKVLNINAGSSILANPQRPNDPKIKAAALDLARGYYAAQGNNPPPEMIEAIATVAAYLSATRGVPVGNFISNSGISLELLQAYNFLKPKGSQVGFLAPSRIPSWANNPTLRGNISAAITDQS